MAGSSLLEQKSCDSLSGEGLSKAEQFRVVVVGRNHVKAHKPLIEFLDWQENEFVFKDAVNSPECALRVPQLPNFPTLLVLFAKMSVQVSNFRKAL